MHTLLDNNGHIPAFTTITDARIHESRILRSLELPKGSIVVFDKGFISNLWFRSLGERGIFFVIRPKRNAIYKHLNRCPMNSKNRYHIRPHH